MSRRTLLLAQAMKVCRNASDAEDLVQDAILRFIQTFEKVDALPDERRCEGWLVTTLFNLFYSQCRRRKVQAEGASDPRLSGENLVVPGPATGVMYDELTDEQFAQAIDELSPKLRTTLEMHMDGRKYHEIAHAEGVPIGTVAKRLHDARARLKEILQRYIHPGGH